MSLRLADPGTRRLGASQGKLIPGMVRVVPRVDEGACRRHLGGLPPSSCAGLADHPPERSIPKSVLTLFAI